MFNNRAHILQLPIEMVGVILIKSSGFGRACNSIVDICLLFWGFETSNDNGIWSTRGVNHSRNISTFSFDRNHCTFFEIYQNHHRNHFVAENYKRSSMWIKRQGKSEKEVRSNFKWRAFKTKGHLNIKEDNLQRSYRKCIYLFIIQYPTG